MPTTAKRGPRPSSLDPPLHRFFSHHVRRNEIKILALTEKLDRILTERGEFLGGITPSIADLFIAPDVFALDIDPAQDDWFSGFPAVRKWLAALREREGYKTSHAKWNKIVPRLQDLLKSESVEQSNPGWVADFLEGE